MLNSDIVERTTDGNPDVEPHLFLLDYGLPEEEIRTTLPRLMQYLNTGKAAGLLRRNLISHRDPWYKQERREPAPFLCTYMGRRIGDATPIRFIWNKSNAIVTNTYLMLYPRPVLASLIKDRPEVSEQLFALLQETARETMGDNWRMHAGGLYKIEPRELLAVRFSSSPAWLVQLVDSDLFARQAAAG
jgi:hypothetical protein